MYGREVAAKNLALHFGQEFPPFFDSQVEMHSAPTWCPQGRRTAVSAVPFGSLAP